MNSHYPEFISELNRKRIIDEMKAIRLENEVNTNSNWVNRVLLLVSDWMIKSGEMLHRRNESSLTHASHVHLINSGELKLEHKK